VREKFAVTRGFRKSARAHRIDNRHTAEDVREEKIRAHRKQRRRSKQLLRDGQQDEPIDRLATERSIS